ncbi:MAG TPA: SDR family oxidoreductase [bacterium]|jgi:NAD(P)-dependent dehydrogenase (short-subunit alcohol dehydrogenase family)|nr:SDR family oxidoreductase [bacterium]
MSENFFITGANRGLGLAIAQVALSEGDTVLAAARQPEKSEELKKLKAQYGSHLVLIPLDVVSGASIKEAAVLSAKAVPQVDVLMNVAGISPGPANATLEQVDLEKCREAYEVNVLGPLQITRTFLPLLKKAKNPRVVHFTSGLASLADKGEGGFYAYGVSKTALNMLSRTMSFDLKKDNIVSVVLDPGWVQTDMGGPNAPLKPLEAATPIVKTAKELTMAKSGQFLYHDGRQLNW